MTLSYDCPVQAPRGTQRPAPRKAGSPRDCAHVSCPWKQSYWKGVWACTIDGGDEVKCLSTCGLRNCKGGRETSSCIRGG